MNAEKEKSKVDSLSADSLAVAKKETTDDVSPIHKIYTYSSPRKGFFLDLGFNNYGSNHSGSYQESDYDLRTLGSRYISLGMVTSMPVVRGRSAGFHIDFGIDFSWYNLMFEGNNTVKKDADAVSFPFLKNAENEEIELKKSKLTVPYVNLAFMPTVSFPRAFISHVSAGMYGGYRLGGYTKTKAKGSGDKDRIRSDYFLNDFRYGLSAEIGIRHFLDFFVNYDLNSLYNDNRGPEVRMLSFGIRL
jgi:hypothetical protein